MTKKGGSKRTKRSAVPAFWKLERKRHPFTVTTSPGPHPKERSYPLAVLMRDILKLAKTYREAAATIKDGKILVDGAVRKTPDFPVGLMDVVEIPILQKAFRMLPHRTGSLTPMEIPPEEKSLKLCKAERKMSAKGGRLQYGFHDGRTMLADKDFSISPGDVCLVEVPSQKILDTVKLSEGSKALAIRGKKAGALGEIVEIKPGDFTRPRAAVLELEGERTEFSTEALMVVGKDKPLIRITAEGGAL